MITFETETELEEFIKKVIKNNLTIEIDKNRPYCYDSTERVEVSLHFNGERFSEGVYDE